jgi:hypothetical protein
VPVVVDWADVGSGAELNRGGVAKDMVVATDQAAKAFR